MSIFRFLVFCVVFVAIFTSCSSGSTDGKNQGILVDRDVLSSILKDVQDKEDSLLAEDGDVFWTPSGSMWHASVNCSYLSNSKEIYHGSLDEARLAGKEKECSRCFMSDEDKLYDEIFDNPISEGDVYFTRDGNLWHSNINCSVIRGAERIYNASVEIAKKLGKEFACNECRQ